MKFASVRLVAADVAGMVAFYETVTGVKADWLAPVFAELVTPGAVVAIGAAETAALFAEGSAEPGANRSAILEFQVADVEAEFARLQGVGTLIHPPKTMPWGNRCFQLRDPEGGAVSLYQPLTEAAVARFGGR